MRIKIKQRFVTACLIATSYSSLQAKEISDVVRPYRYVAAFSVGPAWISKPSHQSLLLAPEIEKTYTQNQTHSVIAEGEFFFGIQYPLRDRWFSQTGIAIAATTHTTLSGEIWDAGNANFNNYAYSYSLQHSHLVIKEKLLADLGFPLVPWLSGSLGVGFNQSDTFQNRPLIPEAIATPNFSDHTATTFTYTLGLGLQKTLTQHLQLGIGYEFADWGAWNLGSARGQTMGVGPGLTHLYTNALIFNVSYTS